MNLEKNSNKKKKKRKLFSNFCYDFVILTGAIPMYIWMRPKVYNPYKVKTPRGGVIMFANHRSMLDPVTVHMAFPFRRKSCLATKDLFDTKAKDKFFHLMNCIKVDKQNFTLSAFHDVVTRLSDGKMVVIFPEGALNLDKEDTVHAFKSGAVLMAHKANAAIVPVYIVKREKWYQRQRIVVGKPIHIREMVGKIPTLAQIDAASESLRQMELELRAYFESLPIAKKLNKNSCQSKGDANNEQSV